MLEVLLDALIDSLKVLLVVFIMYILISFFEKKLADKISKKSKFSVLLGALFGLIPQCGFSVIAADLYLKRHITMGTLIAVFIACSDEALPIFLSSSDKFLMALPLLGSKFIVAFLVGFLIDAIYTKSHKEVVSHEEHCEHEEEVHVGCCHHEIESNHDENESKFHKYLLHPLLHSLKIFVYVLVINVVFGILVYYVKEENISAFLTQNSGLAPLFAVLVGLIPNCASSVIISDLYIAGHITFGTCIAGLICNAGLGFVYLFKNKSNLKNNLIVLLIVALTGLLVGYLLNFIF